MSTRSEDHSGRAEPDEPQDENRFRFRCFDNGVQKALPFGDARHRFHEVDIAYLVPCQRLQLHRGEEPRLVDLLSQAGLQPAALSLLYYLFAVRWRPVTAALISRQMNNESRTLTRGAFIGRRRRLVCALAPHLGIDLIETVGTTEEGRSVPGYQLPTALSRFMIVDTLKPGELFDWSLFFEPAK